LDNRRISRVIGLIEASLGDTEPPVVDRLKERDPDPFLILIATLLSLRTKDEVTEKAAERLFSLAKTPEGILALTEEEISRTIYPVGFYRHKAVTIRAVCRDLRERFDGRVPADMEKLLSLPGVGRKTANLVLAQGFDKPAICVDTHVHRIVNRLGYVSTRRPDETEAALRRHLPRRFWKVINGLLVAFGRTVCLPVSPHCSRCPVVPLCERVGVTRSR